MSYTMKKKWRSAVVKNLMKNRLVKCVSQISDLKDCGTAVLKCGQRIRTGICRHQFESIHHF